MLGCNEGTPWLLCAEGELDSMILDLELTATEGTSDKVLLGIDDGVIVTMHEPITFHPSIHKSDDPGSKPHVPQLKLIHS